VTYRDAVTLQRRADLCEAPLLPLPLALLLAVPAGVALWLSFPSPGVWALAPVGIALLLVALAGHRPTRAALIGLVAGVSFFGPLLWWAGIYVGFIAWVPLTVLEALYVAAFGALAPWALRAPGGPVVRALGVAALWVGVEALRARTPFGGFGWGRLAFSQADAPALPLAALGGAPLLSFAVALAGALVAVAVLAVAGSPARSSRRTLLAVPAALLAAVGVLVSGALVPTPTAPQQGSLQVAGVQGNVPRPGLDFNAERRAVLDNHAAGTLRLADRVADGQAPAPDLVIWPENASDIDPLRNPDAADVIDRAVAAVDVPVLVGAVLVRDDGRLSNTTLLWTPEEGPVASYAKQRPVPFAEYVPYRSFFRAITPAVDQVRRDFVPGQGVGLLRPDGVPVGIAICFEVVEDDLVRDAVRDGAQVLTVQTNNATFGYTDESVQQLAMSRVRAVEHGRAVAHVSTVGVSAMITPDGTVLQDTGLFTADVLQADLPLRTELTPATRAGAWPELVLCLLGAGLVLAGATAGRRGRTAGPTGPAGTAADPATEPERTAP